MKAKYKNTSPYGKFLKQCRDIRKFESGVVCEMFTRYYEFCYTEEAYYFCGKKELAHYSHKAGSKPEIALNADYKDKPEYSLQYSHIMADNPEAVVTEYMNISI